MESDDEIAIWRYIDLGKFVDLLATESLYFACPSQFEDPYEGLVPRSHVEAESKIFQKFIDDILALKYQMSAQPVDKKVKELLDAKMNNVAKSIPEIPKQVMLRFGVNCWHKNEFESEAMWKLYSASRQGIAIKSTIGQLRNSLRGAKVRIDSVRYMDFDNDPIEKGHDHYKLFLKRKSFEHEREVRATISLPQQGKGILVKCDIDILISSIHLAPFAPAYLMDAVESVCRGKLNTLQKPVVKSKLFDIPDYGLNINVRPI